AGRAGLPGGSGQRRQCQHGHLPLRAAHAAGDVPPGRHRPRLSPPPDHHGFDTLDQLSQAELLGEMDRNEFDQYLNNPGHSEQHGGTLANGHVPTSGSSHGSENSLISVLADATATYYNNYSVS
uniref:Sox C-terminal domain-containing protein n=1 Tax=Malurus cyaneus samueli TaxID=2593467 RepID=A0A8C5TP15_9PASS